MSFLLSGELIDGGRVRGSDRTDGGSFIMDGGHVTDGSKDSTDGGTLLSITF